MATKAWVRLHPRLRVVYNGDDIVNASRAGGSNCMAVRALPLQVPAPEPASLVASAFGDPPGLANELAVERFAAGETMADTLPRTVPVERRDTITVSGRAAAAFVNVIVETLPTEPGKPSRTLAVARSIERMLVVRSIKEVTK